MKLPVATQRVKDADSGKSASAFEEIGVDCVKTRMDLKFNVIIEINISKVYIYIYIYVFIDALLVFKDFNITEFIPSRLKILSKLFFFILYY